VSAKRIETLLGELKTNVGASSCTFYIRDPIWRNGFRLAGMTGVDYPEPMYGFSFPATARDVISSGPREHFSKDARRDPVLREDPGATPGVPPSKRLLFGDFVTREKVRSSARLIHPKTVKFREEAVLFVNFKTSISFTRDLKQKIRSSFTLLIAQTSALHAELMIIDASALSKSARILSPDSTIARESMHRLSGGLKSYLEDILNGAIEALASSRGRTLGTIHLYNEEKQHLELAANVGPIKHIERAKIHSVKDGQG
jgi:hypothetical protein